jgi:hypothetical protein
LTIDSLTEKGELMLRVPNLVMRKLYEARLAGLLLPDPQERDEVKLAANSLYQKEISIP